jgi:hypothetical protein
MRGKGPREFEKQCDVGKGYIEGWSAQRESQLFEWNGVGK